MDQAIIDKAKAAHPGAEFHVLDNQEVGLEVLMRAPNDGDWKQFRTMQADEEQSPMALRTLVLACMVEPAPAAFAVMLQTRPGLTETFGRPLIKIGGVSSATQVKKV